MAFCGVVAMGSILSRLSVRRTVRHLRLPFASARQGTRPVHVSDWELAPGPPLSRGRGLSELARGMYKVF